MSSWDSPVELVVFVSLLGAMFVFEVFLWRPVIEWRMKQMEFDKSKLSEGFPLKVEALESKMKHSTHLLMKYIGPRSTPPRYRPIWEWIRTKILRLRPHWRPLTFRDVMPRDLR